jgi:hypothetical protein
MGYYLEKSIFARTQSPWVPKPRGKILLCHKSAFFPFLPRLFLPGQKEGNGTNTGVVETFFVIVVAPHYENERKSSDTVSNRGSK